MQAKKRGQQGEQLAKKLLQNKGYHFLAQNYRLRTGEIDLIFQDKRTIVFVEVKARTTLTQGLPEEAVTPQKLRTIHHVALAFLQEHGLQNHPSRIDVVAIEFTTDPPSFRHLKNVTG